MIFAAGLGTRLKPLTDTMPKALVSIGGEPLIKHVILRLKEAGFQRIVVNVHHFAQQIIDYLEENDHFGLDIRISDETEQLLETGGGIKKARELFDPHSPILIHNVDILSNMDLTAFYDQAVTSETDALLLVSKRNTKRYLLFDEEKQLVGWTNLATGEVKSPHDWVRNDGSLQMLAFSGIHVFNPSLFPLMDQWPDRFPIIDFYLHACATYSITGFEAEHLHMIDVGKLDSLQQAEEFLVSENPY
ncbi:MAG: nucleotidyltransferase family protein [Prevotella sp.]|nr:nucleotidyltransferase family protein [Prevotella sp.]